MQVRPTGWLLGNVRNSVPYRGLQGAQFPQSLLRIGAVDLRSPDKVGYESVGVIEKLLPWIL